MKTRQVTIKPTCNFKNQPRAMNYPQNPPGTTKYQPGTLKKNIKNRHGFKNQIVTLNSQKNTMKTMKNQPETVKNHQKEPGVV